MASRAYQPDRTQAPFLALRRHASDRRLQIDDFLVSEGLVEVLDRPAAPRGDQVAREPIYFAAWPQRAQFKESYAKWLEDSLFDSLPDQMRAHPSFQAIVAQGDRVVPLIASELRREPSFLFLALEEITGEEPVPVEAEGDLNATVAAWLTWLRR